MSTTSRCHRCDGPAYGRGFRHAEGCNAAGGRSGTPRSKRPGARADGAAYSEGRPLRRVHIRLAAALDAATELERRAELEATLDRALDVWEGTCAR